MDTLIEMVKKDIYLDHEIRGLQHKKNRLKHDMVKECINNKQYDLLRLDITKLRRMTSQHE